GAKFGGVLEQVTHDVEVECVPSALPEHFTVDVTKLGLNESVLVGQLVLPEGVKVLTHADVTIANVKGVKEVVSAPETEEAEVATVGADSAAE
ncbi:MAG: 50S ribosomal protein L25, partial [Sphaerochaetaceae bacterium]